jgi:hypothetical protein
VQRERRVLSGREGRLRLLCVALGIDRLRVRLRVRDRVRKLLCVALGIDRSRVRLRVRDRFRISDTINFPLFNPIQYLNLTVSFSCNSNPNPKPNPITEGL